MAICTKQLVLPKMVSKFTILLKKYLKYDLEFRLSSLSLFFAVGCQKPNFNCDTSDKTMQLGI